MVGARGMTYPLDHYQSSLRAIALLISGYFLIYLLFLVLSACLFYNDLSLPTLTSWSPHFVLRYESPYEFTLSPSQPDLRTIALSFLRNKLLRQLVERVLHSFAEPYLWNWCTYQDLNLELRVRSPVFSPLNYKYIWGGLWVTLPVLECHKLPCCYYH